MENAARAQQRLKDKGYAIVVDGDFGARSYAALMNYVGGQRGTVTPMQAQLGAAAARYFPVNGIDTPMRLAQLLAQQSVETRGFSVLVENLNYSVDGLMKTFNRSRISAADCSRLGRRAGEAGLAADRQTAIANILYGGAFGAKQLGNNEVGDGWRFRGRGAKQTTGRANYGVVKTVTGIDVIGNPDLLADPDIGMQAAVIYWDKKGCNAFADNDDVCGLTQRINGGQNGIDDRKAALARAKAILL